MKSLVTGGAGFIGSHLVDALLAAGDEVVVVDNLSTGRIKNLDHCINEISFYEKDIAIDNLSSEFFGVDRVFHLAALADIVPSIQQPVKYYESNVHGTLRVLEVSRDVGVKKFIYAASSSCYGIPTTYPTPETSPIQPLYPYAMTKYLGEQLAIHWRDVYKIPVTSLRFFNVYGPRSRTSGTYGAVFGVFLAQKLNNLPFTVVGDGNQTRDFTYVTDVVSAIMAAANTNIIGKIYNVGSGRSVSVLRLIELLEGDKVFIPKRPGEPDITYADIDLISRDLGWSPKVSIEEGVARVLQEIDYWKEAPAWTPENISSATRDWFKYLS